MVCPVAAGDQAVGVQSKVLNGGCKGVWRCMAGVVQEGAAAGCVRGAGCCVNRMAVTYNKSESNNGMACNNRQGWR